MNELERWPPRPLLSRGVLTCCVLLTVVLLATPTAGAVPSDPGALLRDGVVLAPTEGLAYLMRPAGGIDAVDLATGAVRWHSDAAAKPLTLAGNHLIAQAESASGTLDVVALDARRGALGKSTRVPLPDGVEATVVDAPNQSFRVYAGSAGSQQLVVQWQATSVAEEGAGQGYLPPEGEAQAPSISGTATLTSDASSIAVTAAPASAAAAVARPELQELSAPLSNAASGRQLLSADGRHVLVSQMVAADASNLYNRRWTIYERDSGAEVGSLRSLVAASPFVVRGTTLYQVEPAHATRRDGRIVRHPASLRAVSLETGKDLWKAAIRESEYRGPFPP